MGSVFAAGVYFVSPERPRVFCFYGLPESRLTSQGSSVKYAHFSSSPGDLPSDRIANCDQMQKTMRFDLQTMLGSHDREIECHLNINRRLIYAIRLHHYRIVM